MRDIEDMVQTIEAEPDPASDAEPRLQVTCWNATVRKPLPFAASRKGRRNIEAREGRGHALDEDRRP